MTKRAGLGMQIAGAVLIVGLVVAVAVRLGWEAPGTQKAYVVVTSPAAGGAIGQPRSSLALVGEARGSDGCRVVTQGREVPITEDAFEGVLEVAQRAAEKLVWLDVICEGQVRERFAREIVVRDLGNDAERVEVAAVHLDNEALAEGFSKLVPPLVNPIIAEWLDRLVQGYAEPELYPGARVEVISVRARLRGSTLLLDMEVDVDLRFRDYGGVVHLESDGLRFTGQVRMLDRDRVRVSGVRLNGSLCDAYESSSFFSPLAVGVCEILQRTFQSDLESELGTVMSQQGTLWLQALDRRQLVNDSIVEWAEKMHIDRRLARRLEGAEFEASGLELEQEDSLSFVVTVNRDWLERDPAGPVRVADTPEPIDVGISVALINRVLGIAFDRPFERVITDLATLAEALGFSDEVERAQQRLLAFADPGMAPEDDVMAQWLDRLDLRFDETGKLLPKLAIAVDDGFSIYTSQARVIESTRPGEEIDLGLSIEAEVEIRKVADQHAFDLDRKLLYDRFTLEAFSRDGKPLSKETRVRRAILASRIRAHVTGQDRHQQDPARDGWRLFREALTAVPRLPGDLEIGTMKVKVAEIRTWQQTQIVSFSGRLLVE